MGEKWSGGGEVGAGGDPKAGQLKQKCCTFIMQYTGWAKLAVRSNLVSHAVLLMPLEKCILVV